MKILIPIYKFGSQGGFRVLSELANHWIADGNHVEFLVYCDSLPPNFPTQASLKYYDNSGNIYAEKQYVKKPIFRIFSLINALRKSINNSEYDVILATHSLTAWPVFFSKHPAKKFYYIQAYEPDYYLGNGLTNRVLKQLSKISYRLKLLRIVNSPIYFDYKGIKADKFVFPGIDFTKFRPLAKVDRGTFVIGCIGRIEPFKGTAFVLEAFKELRKTLGSKIELHIAFGEASMAKESGVKIVDVKNDDQLAHYYNHVNVIVAPGTLQLGAVHYPVIEAMACRTPVVTTGYYPANASNSWIVPIKNSDEIRNSILEILNNPELVEQKVSKAFTEIQEFDWNLVSRKMLHYFKAY